MIYIGTDAAKSVLNTLAKRSQEDTGDAAVIVRDIIDEVKKRGDAALADFAEKYENTDYEKTPLVVTEQEIEQAFAHCPDEQMRALRLAAKNIRAYHERQKESGFELPVSGGWLRQIVRPLGRVGIYAPGGTAAYPSSVLMNAVPAQVAGVEEIFLATPAQSGRISPLVLVAAKVAGVGRIFRMGGAQAIAAFTYGTQTVPRVDKITGPGNRYVAEAKRAVFGAVGIDAIAGPSEVVIVADGSANPRYIAADMLAQAEHDVFAAAVLITPSLDLAEAVNKEIPLQMARLPRREIIGESLRRYGAIVVLDTVLDCIGLANEIAPEHLQCVTKDDEALLPLIKNAGGVFLGAYSPEAIGDYVAGTNHVLPTNGTARFASPLGVYDFIKRMSVVSVDRQGLMEAKDAIQILSDAEGLHAHGASAAIRFEEETGL
jgi:histidinol dehydrogenase